MEDLVLIVPVNNEEKILQRNIKKLDNYLSNLSKSKKISYKIIISDNGSTDNTFKIAKKLAKSKHIEVISTPIGKGRAIKEAASSFKAKFYGFIDADLPTKLRNIERALILIMSKNADVVVGNRPLGKMEAPLYRKIISFSYRFIASMFVLSSFKIRDFQAGFKFWNRKANKILYQDIDDSFFFDTEFIFYAIKNKLKVAWLDIDYKIDTKERRSSIKVIKVAPHFLINLFRLRFKSKSPLLSFIFIIIATLFASLSNLFLKLASFGTEQLISKILSFNFILSAIFLLIGFAFFYLALAVGELSRAHPSMALNFLWTNLFAYALLHEVFNIYKVLGILLIITGTIFLNLGDTK